MSSFTNPNHGPNSPTGQDGGQPQSGLDQTRQQVDEVVDIMRNNVEKGKSFFFQIFCIWPIRKITNIELSVVYQWLILKI